MLFVSLLSVQSFVLLALLSLLVFVVPIKFKAYFNLAVLALCTVMFSSVAVGSIAEGVMNPVAEMLNTGGGDSYFTMDMLSSFFVLVVSVVALSTGVYAVGYLNSRASDRPSAHISLHLFALNLLYLSLVGVLTIQDGYGFLLSWELMTIASFVLMLFDAHSREVRKAALNYLVLMHVCFIFLLIGFVTLSKADCEMSFGGLAQYFQEHSPVLLFVVFLLGFGMKSGVFPLHIWLPDAYTAAPAYVSAIMSGAMSKMGVYGVIRVVSYLNHEFYTIGLILLIVGIVTALWGVLFSTMQNDIKRLMAYSSVENLGIIFMAIGASVIGIADGNRVLALCAMGGALFHVLSHSMLKSVLFFSAGNVETQTGTTNMEQLGGIAKRMPMTAIFTLVGVAAICALPPLCGFASEFMIYFGFFNALSAGFSGTITSICAIISLALVGGIAVISFTKLYGVVFSGARRSHDHAQVYEVDSARTVAFTLPVMIIVLAGLLPAFVAQVVIPIAGECTGVLQYGVTLERLTEVLMNVSKVAMLLIAVAATLLFVRRWLLRGRRIDESPTWGCGFTAPTERMQYTGESFSEGLHSMIGSLSKNRVEGEVVGKDEIFPDKHSFKVGHKDRVNELFSQWWVELLHKINVRVMFLRTGKVNYYILYALLFFAIIFLLTLLNLI